MGSHGAPLPIITLNKVPTQSPSRTMRKIEQQMLQAIANRRDWRSNNTEVQCVTFPHGGEEIDRVYVRLHGSTIAIITPNEVDASDCGWQTTTTKRRLNVLLQEFCGVGLYQKNRVWYSYKQSDEQEFEPNSRQVFPRTK